MKFHRASLERVAKLLPRRHRKDDESIVYASVYNEGIATAVRRGAPLACLAIDRRCLYNYEMATHGDGVASLICWCCARRFPYVESRKVNEVRWKQLLRRDGDEIVGVGE